MSIEEPPVALSYGVEQQMLDNGWQKGTPPRDTEDRVASRCGVMVEGNKRCVRAADHLERVVPIPHLIAYAGTELWFKEVWGAGAR